MNEIPDLIQVVDLVSYYEQGGSDDVSNELLLCSAAAKEELEVDKRWNEAQRRERKLPGYGFIDNYINAPLCVWWLTQKYLISKTKGENY